MLPEPRKGRKSKLSVPEIATIIVLFHLSDFYNFKSFYKNYVLTHLKLYFPDLVSYNRFVELIPTSITLLYNFLKFRTKLNSSRGLIESVNNILKRQLKIDHTRHRSKINFLGNLLSGLVAYCFRDKKLRITIPYNSTTSIVPF